MKQTAYILLVGLVALYAISCNKYQETTATDGSNGATGLLTVVIDSEDETKATLTDPRGSDVTGLFAFSSGDKIKVFDGTNTCVGTTTSNANEALFSVEKPFNNTTGSGWVAFPADIVTGMNASNITFTLPTSYTFSEVGGSDPETSKTPVPMIGAYTGGSKVTLKQVGAVMRFRFAVSQIGAGNISFSFKTNVTGEATISSPSPGSSSISSISTTAGSIITVSISSAEWATISESTYAYITLPVPAGLTINNADNAVLVTYSSVRATKVTTIGPAANTSINRAQGYRASASFTDAPVPIFKYKVAASPDDRYVVLAPGNLMAHISEYHYAAANEDGPAGGYAVADEWKFGGHYEYIGRATNAGNYLLGNAGIEGSANATALIGKWVDLFSWQGASADEKHHGLVNYADPEHLANGDTFNDVKRWYGNVVGESLYPHCWETDDTNGSTEGYIHISNGDDYHWRLMTYDEWDYLLNTRTGSTIGNNTGARHARVTIGSVKGLLIFPDGITWRTTAQGGSSECGSDALNTSMTAIADLKGVPINLNTQKSNYDFVITYSTSDMATMAEAGMVFLPCAGFRKGNEIAFGTGGGYYMSADSDPSDAAYSRYLLFENTHVEMYSYHRYRGRSVRLVRDVDAYGNPIVE